MNGLAVPYFLCPAVTVKIFWSGDDGDGEYFFSGDDGDNYGEFYSLAMTIMKIYFFECDRKCWAKYYSTLVTLVQFFQYLL